MNPFRPMTNLCEGCQQKKPSPKVKTPMSKTTAFVILFTVLLILFTGFVIGDQWAYKKQLLVDPLLVGLCLAQGVFIVLIGLFVGMAIDAKKE